MTIVVVVIGGTLGREGVRLALSGGNDVRSQHVLNKVANDINKSLPMHVDKDTELLATVGLDGVFVYSYRLVNHSEAEIDRSRFSTEIRSQLLNSVCTAPPTRDRFLKNGVTLRYMYADKDHRHIATIDVRPVDCRL
jgi:hypothetical protein